MSPSIVILPLDDRPPNYEFPALLAQAAGYEPILPPKAWLGTPWRSGEMEKLAAWLEDVTPGAGAAILALDTLGYGGLVNSRRSADPAAIVMERLQAVRRLKQNQPQLTLLGYSILMRVTRGNDAEEEKAYWGTYGARIFRISYLEDRLSMLAGTPDDEAELAQLRTEVPAELLTDYLEGRARNHAVNRAMIEWTAEGVFDYLIIPQDDTMEYGWNIAEGRRLRRLARRLGVADRVSVYPGADETDMLLIARYAAQQAGFCPRVWTRYSSVRAGAVITAYEDRPMEELIKAHLGPLAGTIAAGPADADLLLYVNSPAEVQGNGFDQIASEVEADAVKELPVEFQEMWNAYRRSEGLRNSLREMYSVQRSVDEFARSLAAAVETGTTCAVVDVAYVNGGDIQLGEAMRRSVDIAQLASFGGWNTAGNTLGTVLAHAVIRHLQRLYGASKQALGAHIQFLFLRFVDDFLYQGIIRSEIAIEELPRLGIHPKMTNLEEAAPMVEAEVNRRLIAAAAEFAERHFVGQSIGAGETLLRIDGLGVRRVFLPWQRLFEIGCEMRLDL